MISRTLIGNDNARFGFHFENEAASKLRRIWPADADMIWPPLLYMQEIDVQRFLDVLDRCFSRTV